MEILRKIYAFLLDSLQTFLIAASVFLVIYVFLFRPFEVKGDSMYPNFYDQEYILTNIIVLKFSNPKLGDVVVFKAPPDPDKDFIKRVVGMPNDTIMIKNGYVYLNDDILDETSYLKTDIKTHPGAFLKEGAAVKIPNDEYFVMGDNRLFSSDSREWGFVKKDKIIGTSMFIYWPLSKLGFIKNPYN